VAFVANDAVVATAAKALHVAAGILVGRAAGEWSFNIVRSVHVSGIAAQIHGEVVLGIEIHERVLPEKSEANRKAARLGAERTMLCNPERQQLQGDFGDGRAIDLRRLRDHRWNWQAFTPAI
jgi:hypothetical protein